jgi:septal ring factor EnvC (AmiA/AmiB activator)
MKKWNKIIWLILAVLAFYNKLSAQKNSEKLKQKQQELEQKIENTKSLIGNIKNHERLTIAELAIINQQIAYREELLQNISSQIRYLNKQIEETKSVIKAMEEDLKRVKEQYAKMVFYAYKNRNTYHNLMFVFASENFNQGYQRAKYLRQFGDYRKRQMDIITQTQNALQQKISLLDEKVKEKENLADIQKKEKENFNKDKEKQHIALNELKKEETKLKKILQEQEETKKRIAQQIKKAIEEEIREQQRKEKERMEKEKLAANKKNIADNPVNNKNNKTNTGFTETPEAQLESAKFENNKGKLPWPVEKGEITIGFGKQPHPTLPGIFTNNNGVDISSTKAAKVRAVFEGTVTSIFVIPGAGKAVMISHGSYRTVYANLGNVIVQKGQNIKTKQEIGTLLSTEDNNISELHFEIWKITEEDFVKQDPAAWLYR